MRTDREGLQALGAAMRSRREALGLSQEELAHRVGLHPTYVSQVEAGKRNVSLLVFVRIARGLKVSPGRLLREAF